MPLLRKKYNDVKRGPFPYTILTKVLLSMTLNIYLKDKDLYNSTVSSLRFIRLKRDKRNSSPVYLTTLYVARSIYRKWIAI